MKNTESKKYWQIGLAIVIASVIIGYSIKVAVKEYKSFDRTVSVKGLYEMEVDADMVIWPVVHKVVGNDLNFIYQEIKRINNIIEDFLIKNGIENSEITINAPEIINQSADRYRNPSTIMYNYYSTSVITVTSNKVAKVRELIQKQAELLKKNVVIVSGEYNYLTVYEYTNLNSIKPQMIENATKNARLAAEKFADDSNSELGKIKSANQGVFSIRNRDANTPHKKIVRVVSSVNYYLND